MTRIRSILQLIRIEQWSKNLFVFLPMFFDRRMFDLHSWISTFIAFCSFCFVSSAIYIFNDIYDVENDRIHPVKCKRPIANGTVSIFHASFLLLACCLLTIFIITLEPIILHRLSNLWFFVLVYFVINLLYTLKLKEFAIIDVFVISIGFVLRVVAGAVICDIYVSHWIILMTFLLALFLALAKRRDDVILYVKNGISPRKNIKKYNLEFLNQSMGIVATMTMVAYVMYTMSEDVIKRIGSEYVYVTAVFVLAGIMKYLQITIIKADSGSPTKVLLKNHFIQACVVGWIFTFGILLYI